jgi:hypothetical protein
MIDTYVYFVSYKHTGGEFGHIVTRDNIYITDKLITTEKDITVMKEYLCDKIHRRNDWKYWGYAIYNFQLLDSYNKEERGKDGELTKEEN